MTTYAPPSSSHKSVSVRSVLSDEALRLEFTLLAGDEQPAAVLGREQGPRVAHKLMREHQ